MRPIMTLTLSASIALSCLALRGPAHADAVAVHKHAAGLTPSDKAFEASMDKMMSSMSERLSGDTDHDFATMMLPHHESAVEMAKIELQSGRDPELRQLATDIVASQAKEVALMRAWLLRHPK